MNWDEILTCKISGVYVFWGNLICDFTRSNCLNVFTPFNESVTVSHTKTVPICGVCIRTVPRRTKKNLRFSRQKFRTFFVVYTRNTNWFLAAAAAAAAPKKMCALFSDCFGNFTLFHSPCVPFSRSRVDSTHLICDFFLIANR